MKTRKSIIRLGNSLAITLPKEIANELTAGAEAIFEIELIHVVNSSEDNIISYECLVCSYHFDSDDDIPYCPSCEANRYQLRRLN